MSPFKQCPNCRQTWPDRAAFLADASIALAGYQVNFSDQLAGFFLFQHNTPECGTSMAIEAREFTDLHDGPVFDSPPPDDCPDYCKLEPCLKPCPVPCECRFVRDVLESVRTWPKQPQCA